MTDTTSLRPGAEPDSADAADLGVLDAARQLATGRLSAAELTDACLCRIEARNGGPPTFEGAPDRINAWARLYPDIAREHAAQADARRAREGNEAPLLCGIPIGLKDLYAVAGVPLTGSSRVLEGNVASRDSTAYTRLRADGMVLLGHTHTHEFAAGGTTDQSGNPWALDQIVGGSSGGSAAALAARMTPATLGSDTCGSLRIPSTCCGTSAIKPTHGRVPLDGVLPLAPTLDHAGPMARTVADCAAVLTAMAAGGPATSPLAPPPIPLNRLPLEPRPNPHPLDGVTVALTDRAEKIPMEDEVARGYEEAVRVCASLGARIVELPAPWTVDPDDLSCVLLTEAWSYHRSHADRHDRYREQVAEFVEGAREFTDAQAYLAAQERRALGTAVWDDWFEAEGVDVLLEPTLPILPLERGPGYERGHPAGPEDPLVAFTALWDVTGMPVVSLPVSWCVGVSLIGPRGNEAPLVQAAIDLQEHGLGIPGDPLA
jgi:aspartyl-tRNA(Asn)/glutamyl-tRNA(Gln) amidotransferase subunit A